MRASRPNRASPASPRSRTRRARAAERDAERWSDSRDGRVALERAVQDVAQGRVQRLEHAEFLEAFDVAWLPARIEWTITDEFARRYERLRGRSHRAVGSALTALVEDLARLAPNAEPKGRHGLQLRRLGRDSPTPGAWALSWSNAGEATFTLEWLRAPTGWTAHVTWLAIGPHGAPDRRQWRGNA